MLTPHKKKTNPKLNKTVFNFEVRGSSAQSLTQTANELREDGGGDLHGLIIHPCPHPPGNCLDVRVHSSYFFHMLDPIAPKSP